MRNIVTPFSSQHNLLDDACPIKDVVGHIKAQLAEFMALKEKSGKAHVDPHDERV